MFDKNDIKAIRILPNDKHTFKTENDFKFFIENTMIGRGGYYYFPKLMMKCAPNTLVMFQYDGMIRAVGILVEAKKEKIQDDNGIEQAGYYKFDTSTLCYLSYPINKEILQKVYPKFVTFNQSKQNIPIEHLDAIMEMLEKSWRNSIIELDEVQKITSKLEDIGLYGESRDAIVKIRVNQGVFRDKLLTRYDACCLCGVKNKALLIASHIKPWSNSLPREKLDIDNGFLMCPNHDKLFDQGWITFDDSGRIIISDNLSVQDRIFLNVHSDMKIILTEKNKKYLEYHRKEIFMREK